MNKTDLSKQLATRSNLNEREAFEIINTLCEILGKAFAQGNAVALQNFGSFLPWHQVERAGRNPRTGEPAVIEARKSVKFKPSRALLAGLNGKE